MNIYKVDHNGSCRSEETGQIHSYHAGVPVELPEDIAKALGRGVQLVDKVAPAKEAKKEEPKEPEEKKHVEKEVEEAPKDKMIRGKDTVKK